MNKTKRMIGGESHKGLQHTWRWPYDDVCGRCVGSNSIQWTNSQKWVHKTCKWYKGQHD